MEILSPNRRTFFRLLAGLGITTGAFPGLPTARAALAQTSQDFPWKPKHWTVTQGGPDGPHPPFVSNSRRLLVPPELPDAPQEWILHSLEWVNYIFSNYPPGLVEFPERRAALYRLDDVLHIKTAPEKPVVQQFYHARLKHAIEDIEQSKTTTGMHIWRMYNQGAFVRTAAVSFAFDIVPGTNIPGFSVQDSWIDRVAEQADALFISHWHPDHANKTVARAFLARKKPVLAPPGLWADDPDLATRLIYPKRIPHEIQEVRVQGGKQVLKFVCYPGHQGVSVLNNVNLVMTPDQYTVLQTGDQFQSNDGGPGSDSEWMMQIGHYHDVDVLLPDGWANGLHHIVRGVNPNLVIPGHENEVGHVVSHRESYTQDYERLFGLCCPYIVMSWGESYLYQKPVTSIGLIPGEN